MIKETNKENLEKADVIPDNLYYYNAVNDAVSIVTLLYFYTNMFICC